MNLALQKIVRINGGALEIFHKLTHKLFTRSFGLTKSFEYEIHTSFKYRVIHKMYKSKLEIMYFPFVPI